MRSLVAVIILLATRLDASAQEPAPPAQEGWDDVEAALRDLDGDREARRSMGRIRQGRARFAPGFLLDETVVDEGNHAGRYKALFMTRYGLVVRWYYVANPAQYLELGKPALLRPGTHEFSEKVRFRRIGLPIYTTRLQRGEWPNLKAAYVRQVSAGIRTRGRGH